MDKPQNREHALSRLMADTAGGDWGLTAKCPRLTTVQAAPGEQPETERTRSHAKKSSRM